MNKHYVCQIKNASLMTKNKQYLNQLNCINKQHNFIVLRALYNEYYEAEIKRSMLLEKLQQIHETLCLKSEKVRQNPTKKCGLKTLQTKNYNHVKTVASSFL